MSQVGFFNCPVCKEHIQYMRLNRSFLQRNLTRRNSHLVVCLGCSEKMFVKIDSTKLASKES